MKPTKATFVTAFALFSLFFGAGNLILPPLLGLRAGDDWWLVSLGFALSAVVVPVLGILAHARLQGGMYDFAKPVSHFFSLAYCVLIYTISVALPAPRTASVTHEMAIGPSFGTPPIWTSLVYFGLVLVVMFNRSRILDLVGKLLTPAILVILLAIIGSTLFIPFGYPAGNGLQQPLSTGILEGYQTFDAIGAVVVGGVIIISVNLQHPTLDFSAKKKLIGRSGMLAGLALLLIYTGLIFGGASAHSLVPTDITRTELLKILSQATLGGRANTGLSILVSLACFTTAVGIVTGAADFMASRFENSRLAYRLTAIAGCVAGVLIGQLNVGMIIDIALPVLMMIYPLTIVLILLNALPAAYAPVLVFRAVVWVTLLASIPDFLAGLAPSLEGSRFVSFLPLQEYQLGWVLPALIAFALAHAVSALKKKQ